MAKKKQKSPWMVAFGRRVRAVREGQGLTQAQLGDQVGCDFRHVGRVERGEQSPRIELAMRLATALDVHICELTEDPLPHGNGS